MSKVKKKLSSEDFYYFSLPMKSTAANLKAVRFCLWLALCQVIVLPVYFLSSEAAVLPTTGPLILVYLLFTMISFFSFITLLLFKATIYEALLYLMAGLFFLELSFLFIIIAYVEFFNSHNEMEFFNSLNLTAIKSEKVTLINQLLLIPLVSLIYGLSFHVYMIKTGKTNKNYIKGNKSQNNSKQYEKIISLFFPIILIFTLLNTNLEIFTGSIMNVIFVLSSIICSFFLPVLLIISYMKLRFSKTYSEKVLRREL